MPLRQPIQNYMSELPHSIGRDIPVEKARDMMLKHRCHHLPVLDGGALVGVVSDRDLNFIVDRDARKDIPVEEVMTPEPLIVDPSTPLSEVANAMLEKHYGSAIVRAAPGKNWGIFTVSDALRVIVSMASE